MGGSWDCEGVRLFVFVVVGWVLLAAWRFLGRFGQDQCFECGMWVMWYVESRDIFSSSSRNVQA